MGYAASDHSADLLGSIPVHLHLLAALSREERQPGTGTTDAHLGIQGWTLQCRDAHRVSLHSRLHKFLDLLDILLSRLPRTIADSDNAALSSPWHRRQYVPPPFFETYLIKWIVISTIASGYLLDRIRGNYILLFGLLSAVLANLLFAVPIPPSTSYFAYGMPAMALAAFGADTVYPCLGLFTTQSLPRKDQGVAGAMFQTVAGIGRSMFLPVTSIVQAAAQSKMVDEGKGEKEAFLGGLRAVEWFCTGCMLVALLVTGVGLRNIGRIGKLKTLGSVQSDVKVKDSEA